MLHFTRRLTVAVFGATLALGAATSVTLTVIRAGY
jgi:hypothetical protein